MDLELLYLSNLLFKGLLLLFLGQFDTVEFLFNGRLFFNESDDAFPLSLQVLLANGELVMTGSLLLRHLASIFFDQSLVLLVH